jgi:hypothetical protein
MQIPYNHPSFIAHFDIDVVVLYMLHQFSMVDFLSILNLIENFGCFKFPKYIFLYFLQNKFNAFFKKQRFNTKLKIVFHAICLTLTQLTIELGKDERVWRKSPNLKHGV